MASSIKYKPPKLSIITINFNGDAHLEETIKSIYNQSYDNYEFLVIDGASSDKSLAIIKKYSQHITTFLSEPDNGIADAMNKGLKLSTGDLILYLHSDDYLINNSSLENALSEIDNTNDIFAYPIRYGNTNQYHLLHPRGFNYWMNFKTGIYHQAAICKKEVFHKIGGFDTDFSITMDYDFFIRAYRSKLKLKLCNKEFSFMRDSGISSMTDQQSLTNRFKEEKKAHLKNCKSKILKFFYIVYWQQYRLYRLFRN